LYIGWDWFLDGVEINGCSKYFLRVTGEVRAR
jgi:hypothetical protein